MNAAIYDESRLFAKTADGNWWYVGQKNIACDEFGSRSYVELGSEFREYSDLLGTEIYAGNRQCETSESGAKVTVEYQDAHFADWELEDLQKFLRQERCFAAMHIRDLLEGYLTTTEQIVEFQAIQYHTGSGYHADSCAFPKIVRITADTNKEVTGLQISIPNLPDSGENRIYNLFAETTKSDILEISCENVMTELTDIYSAKWIHGLLVLEYGNVPVKQFCLAVERYGKEIPEAFQPIILTIQP